MTAERWYRAFYRVYHRDPKIKSLEAKAKVSEREWTKGIDGFLRRLAGSLGYEVRPESKVLGNNRIDHRWSNADSQIAIEYENDWTSVSNEVVKLCNDISPLKILITYVPEKNFVPCIFSIAKDITMEIDKRIGDFKGEFLLIASGYEWNDWCGMRVSLKAHAEPIRLKKRRL